MLPLILQPMRNLTVLWCVLVTSAWIGAIRRSVQIRLCTSECQSEIFGVLSPRVIRFFRNTPCNEIWTCYEKIALVVRSFNMYNQLLRQTWAAGHDQTAKPAKWRLKRRLLPDEPRLRAFYIVRRRR